MAFTVAAVITAYDALGTLVTATKSAYTTLQALLPRPTMPVDVAATGDYTTPLAAQATFDAAWATAAAAYNTAVTAQIAGELAVTSIMPANQWVKMVGLANWGAASTQYIAIKSGVASPADNVSGATLYTIVTSATLPTNHFPYI